MADQSGRVRIKDRELHLRAKIAATRRGTTLEQWVAEALREKLKREK